MDEPKTGSFLQTCGVSLQKLYYQYNNHGDVISVLDQTGAIKNEYDYDASGKYTDPLSL